MSASQENIRNATETLLVENYLSQDERIIVLGPSISQVQLALGDLVDSIKKWRIWAMLAYQDIQLRYRRSIIGPFWITISMAITVYTMGFLYAHLFHQDLSHYFPFLVAGMITWTLISSIITEISDGLMVVEGLVKQVKLPYALYIHRIAYRNILIFFHNIFVLVPIILIYHETAKISLASLMLIPGLLLIYINTISYGLILSMIGARYRDISQVVKSSLQIIFFVTPIMWGPEVLGGKKLYIVNYNPVYHFVELIRQPMLGSMPTLKNIVATMAVTIAGIIFSTIFFSKYRSRIVYWL